MTGIVRFFGVWPLFIAVSTSIAADPLSVQLNNSTRVRIASRIEVNVDPTRDLHGPAVIRAANGDLLLCHQDSNKHRGGDGFVRQWRSTDNGFKWKNEGAASDWRSDKIDSLFGEYGLAPNGRLVMIVQRRETLSGDRGVMGAWVQLSEDHGKSWQRVGPMDGSSKYGVLHARNLIVHDDVIYAGVWSRLGNALYISDSGGRRWKKRSVIFPVDHADFAKLLEAGPPFYPHAVFCPDGSLLALTYHTPPKNHCYSRRSRDLGKTWEAIVEETSLDLWAPRVNRLDDETLIATGRDIGEQATVAWFSTDSGKTWGHKLILDKPNLRGSYAYTDSISAGDGKFWVFTSSPRSPGKGDIVGVLLEVDSSATSHSKQTTLPSKEEDWSAWRGPRGDGSSLDRRTPTRWSSSENIAWKVTLPGQGHASPIVSGDRVFLVAGLPETRERVLLCLDRRSGVEIWRSTVFTAPLEKMHDLNSYASGTPVTDGDLIYVAFLEPDGSELDAAVVRARAGSLRANNAGKPVSPGQMVVAAFDFNGQRRWLARPGPYMSVWGFCSSPVVFEDKVILNGDHDGDAYLVALDRRTGETVWKVSRQYRIRSHSTPIIREVDGRTQMFMSGAHEIVSYNPRDGSEHWRVNGPQGRAVASLVYDGSRVLVPCGYPNRTVWAVRPDGNGDVTDTHVEWRIKQSCPYVPSPAVVDGYFLMVSDQGVASCYNASSGAKLWVERIGRRYSASLVNVGRLVYFLSDDGDTKVVRAGESYDLVAENPLGEPCYASPAISRGQLFVRGEQHLFCIGRAAHDSERRH